MYMVLIDANALARLRNITWVRSQVVGNFVFNLNPPFLLLLFHFINKNTSCLKPTSYSLWCYLEPKALASNMFKSKGFLKLFKWWMYFNIILMFYTSFPKGHPRRKEYSELREHCNYRSQRTTLKYQYSYSMHSEKFLKRSRIVGLWRY